MCNSNSNERVSSQCLTTRSGIADTRPIVTSAQKYYRGISAGTPCRVTHHDNKIL